MSQYDFQGGNLGNGLAWPLDPQTTPPTFGPPGAGDTAEINGKDASSGAMNVLATVFDGASTLEAVTITTKTLTVDAGASVKQNSASSTVTVTGDAAVILNGSYELDNGALTAGVGNLGAAAESIGALAGASFLQTGGKNTVNGDFALGYAGQGASTYTLSGGELDTIRQHIGVDATASGLFVQTGGTDNAGQAIILGTNFAGTSDPAGTGEYDLSGTGTVKVGSVYVGSEPAGAGTFTLDPNGGAAAKLNLSGDPNLAYLAPGLIVGGQGVGTFTQGGGTVTINMTNGNSTALDVGRRDISSGGKGVGTYNFNAGTINVTGAKQNEVVGDSGQGTFLQNNAAGGAQNNDGAGALILGNTSTSIGTYTLGGAKTNGLTVKSIDIGGAVGGAGQATGTFNFDLAGSATLTLMATSGVGLTVGDSGTGAFNQGGGVVTLNASDLVIGAQLGLGGGGKGGTYNLTGGDLKSTGATLREVVGDQDTGVFLQTNGANSTNTVAGTLIIGNQTGGNGTYTLGGPASNVLTANTVVIGAGLASTGVLNYDTAGADAAKLISTAGTGTVGLTVGDLGSGTLNQAGGTLTLTSNLVVGNRLEGASDQGTYNLSGAGSQLTANMETVGDLGVGLFNQSGGVNTANAQLLIGDGVTGNGTYSLMGGGTLNASSIDLGVQQGAVGVFNYAGAGVTLNLTGAGAAPLLTIGDAGQGTFNQSGSSVTTPTSLEVGAQPTGDGTYNLNFGTLNAPAGPGGGVEIIGDQGTGLFNQAGGFNTIGTTLLVGNQGGGDGTYILGGAVGTTLSVQQILIGVQAGSTGVFNDQTGDQASPAWNPNPPAAVQELVVGAAGAGTFNQSADAITLVGQAVQGMNGPGRTTAWGWDLSVGSQLGATGTYNLSAGALSVMFGAVGDSGTGTFVETGGDAGFGAKGVAFATQGTTLSLGDQHSGVGSLNVSGGTVEVYGDAIVGNQGEGRVMQQGSATVTVAGGLIIGNFATGNGAYALSGNQLSVADMAEIGNAGMGTFDETLGLAAFAKGIVLGAGSKLGGGFVNLKLGILNAEQPSIIGDIGAGTFTETGGAAQFITGANMAGAALVIGGDPNSMAGAAATGTFTVGSSDAPATLVIEAIGAQGTPADGEVQIGVNGGTGAFNYNTKAGDAAVLQNVGAADGKAATPGPTFRVGVGGGKGALNDGGGLLALTDIQIAADNKSTGAAVISGSGTTLVTGSLELGALQGAGAGVGSLTIVGGASVEVDGLAAVQGAAANTLLIDAAGALAGHGLIDSAIIGHAQVGGASVPVYSLTVVDNGTLEAGDGSLTIHGAIAGAGVVKLDPGSTLEVTGAVGAQDTISFGGVGDATLIVDDPDAFAGKITGFVLGDRIEFLHTTVAQDFSGGGDSALLFSQPGGELASWQMTGTAITGGGDIGNPGGTWVEAGFGDFNGDGRADILFADAAHDLAIWEMNGTSIIGGGAIGNPGGTWAVKGVGDFNGDGLADILFQDSGGNIAIWEMSGTSIIGGGAVGNPGGAWAVKGVGDFNGDHHSDILFEDASGDYAIWEMNGASIIGGGDIGNPGAGWTEKGIGDFNGDGMSDILFENASGEYAIWEMDGTAIIGGGNIGNPGGTWQFAGVGDYNGNGMADILFQDASGNLAIWEMNGTSIIGGGNIGNPGAIWHVLG